MYSLALAARLIEAMELESAGRVPVGAIDELRGAIDGTPWANPRDQQLAARLLVRLDRVRQEVANAGPVTPTIREWPRTIAGDVAYRIDGGDRIVAVNPGWDRFAAANGGETVYAAEVLGRPIWPFIADEATRELYRQLIQQARGGQAARFTFRCDSPTCRRLMEMSINGREGGLVEFRTRALAEEDRPPPWLLRPDAARSAEPIRACGWCNQVLTGDDWIEVEEATARVGPQHRDLVHGVCGRCEERLLANLAT